MKVICFLVICLSGYASSTRQLATRKYQCPQSTGDYPHPRYCYLYYSCNRDVATLEECPSGLVFNTDIGICYDAHSTDCGQRINLLEEKTSPHPGTEASNQPENEATRLRSSTFLKGTTRIEATKSTPGTSLRPDVLSRTTYESKSTDGDNDNVYLSCPTAYGLFPHPTNPRKFIHCQEGYPHVKDCPHTLIFNRTLKVCTWG